MTNVTKEELALMAHEDLRYERGESKKNSRKNPRNKQRDVNLKTLRGASPHLLSQHYEVDDGLDDFQPEYETSSKD